jgi:mono/diheme cytochrome c family protein
MLRNGRSVGKPETLAARGRRMTCLVAAAVAMIWSTADTSAAQEREDYNSGSYLYRAFCAACHGADGKGNGPAADTLARPVPDLTLLTRNAGGTFPRDRVLEILDGTRSLPGHSGSAMPRWSDVFKGLERDPGSVRKRLAALVDHLESLQLKDPR